MVCFVFRRAAIVFSISILIFGIRCVYHWCGWCFVHLANLIIFSHIKFLSMVAYSVNVREEGILVFMGGLWKITALFSVWKSCAVLLDFP